MGGTLPVNKPDGLAFLVSPHHDSVTRQCAGLWGPMGREIVAELDQDAQRRGPGHALWLRLVHWLIALAVMVLLFSGFTILMAHPRLYWGDTGNDLMRPFVELPISPNYKHGGWEHVTPFFAAAGSPVTAERHFYVYNQNGWARSLHFMAAWAFVLGLGVYLGFGIISGHIARALWLRRGERTPAALAQDIKAHLRFPMPAAPPGGPYNVLQKLAYCLVTLVALPLMFLTGITLSPAIAASYPALLDVFGGTQSARTIHFLTFAFVALFLLVHLAMIVLTGPLRQLRGMILGR
jgi:thiosulfate reductase cytochrome b subunit